VTVLLICALEIFLKPNSITLSSLQQVAGQFAIKFHYTIQLATSSRAGLRPASRDGWRAASELDENLRVHVVCVAQAKFHYAVQLATSSRAGLRQAQAGQRNGIWPRTGLRPASEQDSVVPEWSEPVCDRVRELSRHVEIART